MERDVAKLKVEQCTGHRVQASIEGSIRVIGYREKVYACADNNDGFYASEDRTTAIAYDGKVLVVDIAFNSLQNARQFVRDVKGIVRATGFDMVTVNAKIVEDERIFGADSVIFADDCRG